MITDFMSMNTSLSSQGYQPDTVALVTINGTQVYAQIANTTEQQTRGLAGVSDLREDEGMLFAFTKPGYYSFWMKGMIVPIDIIWIGENGKVIGVTENVSPESYPQIYQPTTPSLYVLEVKSGWAARHNVSQGDLVDIKATPYL